MGRFVSIWEGMCWCLLLFPDVCGAERAVVTTLAGGVSGTNTAFADGSGSNAGFNGPTGVAVDTSGNVYVADRSNHRIRKVTAVGGTWVAAITLRASLFDINVGADLRRGPFVVELLLSPSILFLGVCSPTFSCVFSITRSNATETIDLLFRLHRCAAIFVGVLWCVMVCAAYVDC